MLVKHKSKWQTMKRGYIRVSKAGPSLEDQRAALARAGITDQSDGGPVYVDAEAKGRRKGGADARLVERARALLSLRAGDVLVVHSLARLGTSTPDTMAVLGEIAMRGASLYLAAAGRALAWHPDAAEIVAAVADAERERRQEIAAKARRAAADMGAVRGPARSLALGRRQAAAAAWADVLLTAAQVEAQTGIPVRTLYRMFGPRGTPRFGGK